MYFLKSELCGVNFFLDDALGVMLWIDLMRNAPYIEKTNHILCFIVSSFMITFSGY